MNCNRCHHKAINEGKVSIVSSTEDTILRITPSNTERSAGEFGRESIELALRALRIDGILVLEDVVDLELIDTARAAFHGTYAEHLDGPRHDHVKEVGEKRVMISIDLAPPFDDPSLFANPWLCQLLESALDRKFVIDAYGAVCSQPGAPKQHIHSDGSDLFAPSGLDRVLPAVAMTVAIPLLEMNHIHGTTALWPGSHRAVKDDDPPVEPVVKEGSIVLWDYRLVHGGTPNKSSVTRPLMYMTYCRPWWVDCVNFSDPFRRRVRARKGMLAALSEEHRRLLVRAEEV
jgi:ectoine hydroxylase-related dioxygenase (phytanoyl-CoA dioxygenase family)